VHRMRHHGAVHDLDRHALARRDRVNDRRSQRYLLSLSIESCGPERRGATCRRAMPQSAADPNQQPILISSRLFAYT
jgi:hypothetical protein